MDKSSDETPISANVEFTGFRDVDAGSMVVLKKMVNTYAKRFSERCADFQKLRLILKKVHKSEDGHSLKFEVQGHLFDGGKTYTTEVIDHNVFVTVDGALKKLENEALKGK